MLSGLRVFHLHEEAFIIQDNAVIGNIFNAVGFHYRITAANALLWIRLRFTGLRDLFHCHLGVSGLSLIHILIRLIANTKQMNNG